MRKGKNEILSDVIGVGLASVVDVQSFIFLFFVLFFFYQRKMNLDHDQTSVPEQFPRGELPPSLG